MDSFTSEATIEFIDGQGQSLSEETRELLRTRLLAAASIFLAGYSISLIYSLLSGHFTTPRLISWGISFPTMGVCAFLLSKQAPQRMSQARAFEWVIFGAIMASFLINQYGRVVELAPLSNRVNVIPPWIILIFLYGFFIPNRWQRSAVVLSVFVAAPIIMNLSLKFTRPDLAEALPAVLVLENGLLLLFCGASAVVGSQILNQMRREMHKLRRFGQYQLGRKLGEGGMGEVYEAEHVLLKRPCALKLIKASDDDVEAIARFEREVRSTASLSHWNSIAVYDYGVTADGTFYYVMEYLPGKSLDELISKEDPLPPARVVSLIRQLCGALSEAHSRGMVHRDIKPSNIQVTYRGGLYDVAKLLDFGLVKPIEEQPKEKLTAVGMIVGTVFYMSPEQAMGHETDGRSDLYSLGATIYEALTGHVPFTGETPVGVLMQHITEPLKPLRDHVPELPEELEQIVMKCMEKKPEDRYQTASELEQALDAYQSAGLWSQESAAEWWRCHVPGALAPSAVPAGGQDQAR